MDLNILPDHVLANVFKHVPGKDLIRSVQRVCRRWHNLVPGTLPSEMTIVHKACPENMPHDPGFENYATRIIENRAVSEIVLRNPTREIGCAIDQVFANCAKVKRVYSKTGSFLSDNVPLSSVEELHLSIYIANHFGHPLIPHYQSLRVLVLLEFDCLYILTLPHNGLEFATNLQLLFIHWTYEPITYDLDAEEGWKKQYLRNSPRLPALRYLFLGGAPVGESMLEMRRAIVAIAGPQCRVILDRGMFDHPLQFDPLPDRSVEIMLHEPFKAQAREALTECGGREDRMFQRYH